MSAEGAAGNERRAALLQAASGVFLRYGFKKTSMDDLARAAGLSRQGLYLSFPTKEALFREVLTHKLTTAREATRAALARSELEVEERLFGAFEAAYTGKQSEHMSELMVTATELVGPLLEELDRAFISDLTRVLKSSGAAAPWDKLGISAKALAEQLTASSHGFKQRTLSRDEYLARMRTAVRIICRGARK
jgi:AcrR family transcriptional regulator